MKQFMEFISIDITTLIVSVLNLFVLYLILKRFLFARIDKVLTERENDIKHSLQEAESSKQKSEALKQEYNEKLAQANIESKQIIENARKNADHYSERMRDETKEELRLMKLRASEEMESEKTRMYEEVKGEIADISTQIASKIIEREINKNDHEHIIDSFIEKLEVV